MSDRLRIATMVRGYLPMPPGDIAYAPYYVAADIANGLQARGHEVTFYAPEGSHLDRASVKTLSQAALAQNATEHHALLASAEIASHDDLQLADYYYARDMFHEARAGHYDVLLFHHPETPLPFLSEFPAVPVLSVLHDPISEQQQAQLTKWRSPNHHLIAISNSQRRAAPQLPYATTIYNGIDTELFAYNSTPEDYLLFVGSLQPTKGAHLAIKIAQATKQRLLIIGHTFPDKQTYFDEEIKPHLNEHVQYLGPKSHAEMPAFFQKARALLMPIQWEEPFGLVMAEAMACGTPVVAFDRGSVSEVVSDGETGFIVDTSEQMIQAVGQLHRINRQTCRQRAVAHFSVQAMVQNYETVLRQQRARGRS